MINFIADAIKLLLLPPGPTPDATTFADMLNAALGKPNQLDFRRPKIQATEDLSVQALQVAVDRETKNVNAIRTTAVYANRENRISLDGDRQNETQTLCSAALHGLDATPSTESEIQQYFNIKEKGLER